MGLQDKIRNHKYIWLIGLLITLGVIAVPVILFVPGEASSKSDPWANVPDHQPATDHSDLIQGPFETGSQVTLECLRCHEEAAHDVMDTVHWTWESKPYEVEGRDEPVTVGKKNSLNNFCLGIQSNWAGCTSCHAGYGWTDADFDFSAEENVDCLVCHEQTGGYGKTKGGFPAEGVDLLAAAQSVTTPTRENCGWCHFNGGGGNAVKHGDLDEHLYYPSTDVDVHMGENDFLCIDCHKAEDHQIRGRSISVSLDTENQVYCTDCHLEDEHEDERLNAHTQSVACQTCHIPTGGTGDPTKMEWDWSTAGQDLPESTHEYLKIKGSFIYEGDFTPEYFWYSGVKDRYIINDKIDPNVPTEINTLAGDINDPEAKIFPFKVHRAKQPYDTFYNILLQPRTAGEGGFWTTFDWDSALRLGAEDAGHPFSGQYGFAETIMYWPITHLVVPSEDALQCTACHGDNGRLDWEALGYPGDPMEWGSRFQSEP